MWGGRAAGGPDGGQKTLAGAVQPKRAAVPIPPVHMPGSSAIGQRPVQQSAGFLQGRSVPSPPQPSGQAAIQKMAVPKWAKNVGSLGIRKVYVWDKRRRRANAAAAANAAVNNIPVPQQPAVDPDRTNSPLTPIKDVYGGAGNFTLDELYEHLEAYEKARHFHATKSRNADAIKQVGLLRDRGGHDDGASGTVDPSSQQGNKNKVFLGGDRRTALYYENQLRADQTATPETLRVFVTPDEAEELRGDFGDDDNQAFWTPTHDFSGDRILRGKFRNATREELRAVFRVVKEWYPANSDADVDEIIARHLEAIARGLTVHAEHPGGQMRGRYIRPVRNPRHGIQRGHDEGYESD
jgi:hypothetical protein